MNTPFRFDPVTLPTECSSLRAEVRAFLAAEKAAGGCQVSSDFGGHFSPGFSRRLGAKGWIGMTWPRRYGGGERTTLERYVVTEEPERAAPAALRHRGAAPALPARHLPRRDLFLHRHERARFGLRPRLDPQPRRTRGGRLGAHRRQDLDEPRPCRALHDRPRPHRAGRQRPPRRAEPGTHRPQIAGDRDKADPQPRRHRGFQRGRLRPRLHPRRHADRRGRRRLEAGDQRARL